MIERPQDSPDVPAVGFRDELDQRYAALEKWSGSAETMTMPALPRVPPLSSRPVPEPGAEPSSSPPVPAPSSFLRRSAPRVVPGPRSRRVRMAALYGAALVGLIGAVTAVWGASGEPRTAAPAVAGGAAAQPVTARGADPSAVPGRPPAPRSPARSAGVVATHSHRPSAPGAPSTSPATAVLPGLAAVDTTRVPPRATGTAAAGPARLTASYGYTLDEQTGYAGSIRLRNSGDAEAGDWTVRLTVPGGEQVLVTGGDVEVSQSGTDVTFRPASPAGLDAGSSAGFTFTLDRVPARPPAGCTVNGTACT